MKKKLTGVIKSDKMTGTVSVTVTRLKTHPLYLKRTK
ncbi:MAG: 30S ribosomal protein S17, partial [Microgenomates group bacterium]